ncbi:hypothetical protein ABZV77_36440 [Streptomyces sp. NPDC004732]|uniref:hypothetical protein n=1 Tax=Streptomyces sp. NPDC004732 TaxID=3154290 RepID=UPI0033B24302
MAFPEELLRLTGAGQVGDDTSEEVLHAAVYEFALAVGTDNRAWAETWERHLNQYLSTAVAAVLAYTLADADGTHGTLAGDPARARANMCEVVVRDL